MFSIYHILPDFTPTYILCVLFFLNFIKFTSNNPQNTSIDLEKKKKNQST